MYCSPKLSCRGMNTCRIAVKEYRTLINLCREKAAKNNLSLPEKKFMASYKIDSFDESCKSLTERDNSHTEKNIPFTEKLIL